MQSFSLKFTPCSDTNDLIEKQLEEVEGKITKREKIIKENK